MNASCEACLDRGVIVTCAGVVQRCDSCDAYPDDESAARAVSPCAIKLTCTTCDYWEMSITGRSIPCTECFGMLRGPPVAV